VESTAARRAVGVACARTGNELRALGDRRSTGGAASRGLGVIVRRGSLAVLGNARSGLSVRALDLLCGDVVGGGISETTTTVPLLSDDGSGAFAAVEAAAGGGAVDVRLTWASNELGARSSARDVCGSDNWRKEG
jgi:hypothetical protein